MGYSETALPLSDISRGQPGMDRTSAPVGPNAIDGGLMSKPNVLAQPSEQNLQMAQADAQNLKTRAQGMNSQARRDVSKQITEMSGAEEKAQSDLRTYMHDKLGAGAEGSMMMRVSSMMNGPDRDAFMYDIAAGQALGMGMNPDLGQAEAEAKRYRK